MQTQYKYFFTELYSWSATLSEKRHCGGVLLSQARIGKGYCVPEGERMRNSGVPDKENIRQNQILEQALAWAVFAHYKKHTCVQEACQMCEGQARLQSAY